MRKWIGLIALIVCMGALATVLTGAVSRAADSVVTDIRIDDDGVLLGDEAYERGEGISRRSRVSVIGEDIVQFGDDINVEEDEVVEGDVVAILGSIVVDGMVEGDVVAVGGELTVGPRGEIDGDAVAIGGGVTKEPGAKVRGETVSIGSGTDFRPSISPVFAGSIFSRGGRLLIFIIWIIMLIVLGLIIVAVFRRGVDNVCMRARKEAFKMGLIGLLAEVLLIPAIVLFVITIIGIPIGVFVLPLLFALAALLGIVGVSYAVGGRLGNGHGRSVYVSIALGLFVLHGLAILGGLIGLPGGSMSAIGKVISFFGWAVLYVAVTVGLGAVIMSKFGTAELKPKPATPVPSWDQPASGEGPKTPPSNLAGGQGPQGMPPQGSV
jgi:hypothetical protein